MFAEAESTVAEAAEYKRAVDGLLRCKTVARLGILIIATREVKPSASGSITSVVVENFSFLVVVVSSVHINLSISYYVQIIISFAEKHSSQSYHSRTAVFDSHFVIVGHSARKYVDHVSGRSYSS